MRIWKLRLFALIMVLSLVTGCGGEQPSVQWQDGIKASAANNKFALVFVYADNSSKTKEMRKSLKEAVKLSDQPVDYMEADYEKNKEELLKFAQSKQLEIPIALMVAPNGVITRSYTSVILPEAIKNGIVTGKKLDFMRSVQDRKNVYACLYKDSMPGVDRVKKLLAEVEKEQGGKCVVYYLNYDNPEDADTISSLPTKTLEKTVAVLAMIPDVGINAILQNDFITKTNLLKAIDPDQNKEYSDEEGH